VLKWPGFWALLFTAAVVKSEVTDVRVLKAEYQEKENRAGAICKRSSARTGSCLV
jgi:hypothetical protein